jgi:hypothetical protein
MFALSLLSQDCDRKIEHMQNSGVIQNVKIHRIRASRETETERERERENMVSGAIIRNFALKIKLKS